MFGIDGLMDLNKNIEEMECRTEQSHFYIRNGWQTKRSIVKISQNNVRTENTNFVKIFIMRDRCWAVGDIFIVLLLL